MSVIAQNLPDSRRSAPPPNIRHSALAETGPFVERPFMDNY